MIPSRIHGASGCLQHGVGGTALSSQKPNIDICSSLLQPIHSITPSDTLELRPNWSSADTFASVGATCVNGVLTITDMAEIMLVLWLLVSTTSPG
jgi:hypothetical protein